MKRLLPTLLLFFSVILKAQSPELIIQLVYATGSVSDKSPQVEYKGLFPGHIFKSTSSIVVGDSSEVWLIINQIQLVGINKPGLYPVKDLQSNKSIISLAIPAPALPLAKSLFLDLKKKSIIGKPYDIKKYLNMELNPSGDRCCTFAFYALDGANKLLRNNKALIKWGHGNCNQYEVKLMSMTDEELKSIGTEKTQLEIELKNDWSMYVVNVNSPNNSCSGSMLIEVKYPEKEMQLTSFTELENSLTEFPEIFRELMLGEFFNQNKLILDAVFTYEKMVAKNKSMKIYYGIFLESNNISSVLMK